MPPELEYENDIDFGEPISQEILDLTGAPAPAAEEVAPPAAANAAAPAPAAPAIDPAELGRAIGEHVAAAVRPPAPATVTPEKDYMTQFRDDTVEAATRNATAQMLEIQKPSLVGQLLQEIANDMPDNVKAAVKQRLMADTPQNILGALQNTRIISDLRDAAVGMNARMNPPKPAETRAPSASPIGTVRVQATELQRRADTYYREYKSIGVTAADALKMAKGDL